YQIISHEEAEFYAFPGPVYDFNNNLRTDEDLIERVYDIEISQSQGDSATSGGGVFGLNNNVYISPFDSSLAFKVIGLWKPADDLLVLNYSIEGGIENAEDLIPPSGSENLTQCNVQFGELNENLMVPGLDERVERQIIWWNYYDYDFGVETTKIGCDFEKIEYSKISYLKTPISLNPDNFYSLSLGMIRENREYELGDLWTDENGDLMIFEKPKRRDHMSGQLLERYIIQSNDTLQFNPGGEIYLPAIDNFNWWNNILYTDDGYRICHKTAISPTGAYETSSRDYVNQPVFSYYLYDKAAVNQMELSAISFRVYDVSTGIRYRLQSNTRNYYLLGQNGHSTIDYEFYVPDLLEGEYHGNANQPVIDQMIVLSNDKVAQWLRPSGDDNKIRLLVYDANHDIDQVQCSLIPSSGEKIALDMEIDQEKREVFASIPDNLAHEFIDFEAMVTDSSGNQIIFTAAPAFFYGNSLQERVYDSRVFLYTYNLENPEQFPFAAGDSLSFSLNLTNNGNMAADSILITYPTTSIFQPLGNDSVFISTLLTGDSTAVTLNVQVLEDNSEDVHFVYTPEIHWKTNNKSYMREYPVYIKTWQPEEVSSIHSEPEVSTKLRYQLYCNYPNPFNPSTTIRFQLPQTEKVTIAVYNMLGQQVKTLTDRTYLKGNHEIVWDGKNAFGETVTSGIYFVRIRAGDFVENKKMLLIK
ncbi:MAG: T9SS type A sorting domain-containing protein, partial [bacterium]